MTDLFALIFSSPWIYAGTLVMLWSVLATIVAIVTVAIALGGSR